MFKDLTLIKEIVLCLVRENGFIGPLVAAAAPALLQAVGTVFGGR